MEPKIFLPGILIILTITVFQADTFNGELAELECPDECECHYFRINWVTDCSESNLTEIPYDELSLNVYVLDMNGNRISTLKQFPEDIKLRRLQLADNLLTELDAEPFTGLGYLLDADLSGNKITRVDPEAFSDSPGFITLELQGNPLDSVEGPFLSSHTLLYLDISSCGLTNINPQFFTNITALSTLDLSNNPLMDLKDNPFEPLISLEILKLNNCNLTHIDPVTFSKLSNLKTLELERNELTGADWTAILKNLIRLEYLNLRNSKLKTIADDAFNNCVWMRTLILGENQFVDLNVANVLGHGLKNLETLDLSNCHLIEPMSENAFENLAKLRTLHLSGNTLSSKDLFTALKPLVNVQTLSLSDCGLSQLPDSFNIFTNLQELDISRNPLCDAFTELLAPLEKLEYLNMGYSNLSYISPDTFSKMTSMKRLVLSGNDLNSLEAGLFGNLTHLESLELDFCGLRRPLNATVFFNNLTYTDLKELKLAGNPLRISKTGPFLPKQLSRLQMLDLSNCNLTSLPEEAFSNTKNITKLILQSNNFSSDTLKFLKSLPQLEELDLSNNNFTILSPKVFDNNPKLRSLKLIGNPWKCNCEIAEMWDWANIYKNDLGILVGSLATPEDTTVGGQKRKKGLFCHYNETQMRDASNANKTTGGRRPFINPKRELHTMNRTWAKYVRESGCVAPPKHSRHERHISSDYAENDRFPATWIMVFGSVSFLILGIMGVAIEVVFYVRKVRRNSE